VTSLNAIATLGVDVARATDAGFDGHVAKPPDPARLESLRGH
jgi:hypothetical protein